MQARTADGVTLHIERVPAVGARRAVVVCLHAMMTDGRYFRRFADALAREGCDVLVPDFRGHGRSSLRAGRDDWSFDDLVEFDLPAIIAATDCDPRELALLGHSLGGLVTTAALGIGAIPPPRLLLLPATSVWLLGPDGPLARRALMSLYRHVTAALGRAPIRALRIGSADEPATFVRQLTGWTRAARWTSLRGIDYLAAMRMITTRVIPFVGTTDKLCTPDDARGFAARFPNAAPLRIVGTRHGDALDPDHFTMFTRTELEPFWRELLHIVGEPSLPT